MHSTTLGIHNGAFNATFTEHCAGKTAPFHVIYRKEGYAHQDEVAAPYAAQDRDNVEWNYKISRDKLAHKMGLSEIASYELFKDDHVDKVYGVRFSDGSRQSDYTISQLQGLLGDKNLKSSDFVVSSSDDNLSFTGHGVGLGTGLCVFSAEKMANKGKNAADILSHFFPHTSIVCLDQ